jgi:multidrug efflux pump subunit AcrA (membrane-fusion protein)
MDLLAIGFVILMMFVGGATALLADILGFKIGKKKLSLFRIRPKHIAQISVTAAGFLIPLFTIGIFYFASADFRVWLTRGSKAIIELKGKTQELESVNRVLASSSKLAAQLKAEKATTEASLQKSKAANADQQKKLELSRAQYRSQSEQLQRITASVSSAKRTIQLLNAKNSQSASRLNNTETLLTKARTDLTSIATKLSAASKEYASALKSYNETNQQNLKLTKSNLDLEKANKNLNQTLGELSQSLDDLKNDVDTLTKEKESADLQSKNAAKQLEVLNSQITSYLNQYAKLEASTSETASIIRHNGVTFSKGEEVARTVVPASLTSDDATALLTSFLRKCRLESITRGAKSDSSYPFEGEAGILAVDRAGNILREGETFRLMTNRLTSLRTTGCLIATAQTNRFTGEPVPLIVAIEPNPVVFKEGEIIAESKIDGRKTEIELFADVRDFVRTFVNARARRAKMIPVRGREGESFGEIRIGQMLEAVNKVRSVPRILRLQAVATSTIRAADTLEFEIVIK